MPDLAYSFVLGLAGLDLDPIGVRRHNENHLIPAFGQCELTGCGTYHDEVVRACHEGPGVMKLEDRTDRSFLPHLVHERPPL